MAWRWVGVDVAVAEINQALDDLGACLFSGLNLAASKSVRHFNNRLLERIDSA